VAGTLTRRQAVAAGTLGAVAALAGGAGLVRAGGPAAGRGRPRLADRRGRGQPGRDRDRARGGRRRPAHRRGRPGRLWRQRPVAGGARALAVALPTAQVTVAKGCHDGAFWQRVAPAQLHFLAGAVGGRRAGG